MSETETETPPSEPEPVETPESPPEPEPENPDAEPVEPIEPPGEPPETPQEPSEPTGMSEKEREAQQKKIDKEAKRHTDTITALLGDEAADVTGCPFCDPRLLGFFYDAQLANPRSEMQAAMIEALSRPRDVEYLDAEDVSQCDRCGGEGNVKTGSKVPQRETKVCKHCNGFGYYPPPNLQQNGEVPHEEGRDLVAVGAGAMVQDEVDPSGHPRLLPDGRPNPNYGKWPQYVDPAYP